MGIKGLWLLMLLCLSLPCVAEPAASWEGLTGLFTQPTAQILPRGNAALTYSEIRFGQENCPRKSTDTWFTGSLTAALSQRWEIGITSRHELVKHFCDDSLNPVDKYDASLLIGDVKYLITPPAKNRVGIAIGVKDITDATSEVGGFCAERGRRFFLVGSYDWAHFGLTQDDSGVGAYAGADFPIGENVDFVAEYVTRPSFVHLIPEPDNTANFNLGVRFFPRAVPGLRIDTVAVGDGEFNFGFSFSYRFRLFK